MRYFPIVLLIICAELRAQTDTLIFPAPWNTFLFNHTTLGESQILVGPHPRIPQERFEFVYESDSSGLTKQRKVYYRRLFYDTLVTVFVFSSYDKDEKDSCLLTGLEFYKRSPVVLNEVVQIDFSTKSDVLSVYGEGTVTGGNFQSSWLRYSLFVLNAWCEVSFYFDSRNVLRKVLIECGPSAK
jgi:hypothetical protein